MKRALVPLAVLLLAALAVQAFGSYGATQSHKVDICHATGSASNTYVGLNVDDDAVDGSGNSDHNRSGHQNGEDIIPPFYDDGSPGYWSARNWGSAGQAIFYNGCEIAESDPAPTATATLVPAATSTPAPTATDIPTDIFTATPFPTEETPVPTEETPVLTETPIPTEETPIPTGTPTETPTSSPPLPSTGFTGRVPPVLAWKLDERTWAVHAGVPNGYELARWNLGYVYDFAGRRVAVRRSIVVNPTDAWVLEDESSDLILVTCTVLRNGVWTKRLVLYVDFVEAPQ